jgi:hypothetical protein
MRWWIEKNDIAILVTIQGRPTALNPCGTDTGRLTANCNMDVNVRGVEDGSRMCTLAIATAQNGSQMID